MSTEEIRKGLAEARRLPDGPAKTEFLETLAQRAKSESDRPLEAEVLLALSNVYEFGGEADRQPVAFARLLKIYDEFPVELGVHTHSIHWQLKWMTSSLMYNPAVPLASVHKWMDEFESRYRQRGYSSRPVHAQRSDLAMLEGDKSAARAFMEASVAAPRDEMANCAACESNARGELHADLGEDADACREWEPVLAGRLRCREEPARVMAKALAPLVRLGRLDEARSAHLRGYPLARGNASLRAYVGYHIEFCALSGNEARGLEILIEHKNWLTDEQQEVSQRRQFITGALILLRRLALLGLDDVAIGSQTVATVLEPLSRELEEICARFDARNGSSFISDMTARRLGAAPFADGLPMGFSAKLPERTTPIVPSPQVVPVTLEGQIEEAALLTQQRHPQAGRAWLRVAKLAEERGEELSASVTAEIDRRRAEKLFETDPEAAHRALLEIAERFAGIGELGNALRARSQAAVALSRAGDRSGAEEAAEAVFEEGQAAFDQGQICAHECLVARRAPLNVAYDALVRQDTRSEDDLEELTEFVGAEVRVAARLEDEGVEASYHEMLAQLAHWRQDTETAVGHLTSAMELYVAAEQPWFAAAPAATLAQFGLERDAAQAEAHARQAIEFGGSAIDPTMAAHLSSLLVEAISRQQGRESDIVDAALRASARWQGISEPDELHLTFTAARAYHAQGRHSEAATLFGEVIARVEIPYDPHGVAMTRKAYGESLRAVGDHKAAAEQMLIAARLLEEHSESKVAYAQVSWAAAESLAASGNPVAAITAYEKAVELWQELASLVPLVRCRRSIAWLYFQQDQRARALALMREVQDDLSKAATAEAAAELAETENQINRMMRVRPRA